MKHIKETNNKKKNSTRKKGKFSGTVFLCGKDIQFMDTKRKLSVKIKGIIREQLYKSF